MKPGFTFLTLIFLLSSYCVYSTVLPNYGFQCSATTILEDFTFSNSHNSYKLSTLSSSLIPTTTAYSVGFWFKTISGTAGADNYFFRLTLDDTTTTTHDSGRLMIKEDYISKKIIFIYQTQSTPNNLEYSVSLTDTRSKWIFVAASIVANSTLWDGTSTTGSVYFFLYDYNDGNSYNNGASSSEFNVNFDSSVSWYLNTQTTLYVGGDMAASGYGDTLNIQISDLIFYPDTYSTDGMGYFIYGYREALVFLYFQVSSIYLQNSGYTAGGTITLGSSSTTPVLNASVAAASFSSNSLMAMQLPTFSNFQPYQSYFTVAFEMMLNETQTSISCSSATLFTTYYWDSSNDVPFWALNIVGTSSLQFVLMGSETHTIASDIFTNSTLTKYTLNCYLGSRLSCILYVNSTKYTISSAFTTSISTIQAAFGAAKNYVTFGDTSCSFQGAIRSFGYYMNGGPTYDSGAQTCLSDISCLVQIGTPNAQMYCGYSACASFQFDNQTCITCDTSCTTCFSTTSTTCNACPSGYTGVQSVADYVGNTCTKVASTTVFRKDYIVVGVAAGVAGLLLLGALGWSIRNVMRHRKKYMELSRVNPV